MKLRKIRDYSKFNIAEILESNLVEYSDDKRGEYIFLLRCPDDLNKVK